MIKIIHAYPNLMNLYGEYANALILQKRLECAGLEAVVTHYNAGEDLDLSECDFLYIGSGDERSTLAALRDMIRHSDELKGYVERGGKALLTGSAGVLISHSVTLDTGEAQPRLWLSDINAIMTGKVRYAEYVVTTPLVESEIIGVINTTTKLSSSQTPFFTIQCGTEPSDIKTEGFVKNSLYTTQFTGPLLVRNPALLDYFAALVAGRDLEPCGESWFAHMIKGHDTVLRSLKDACAEAVDS